MTRMKDSGNPWVREIPSDWFEKKLRYLVELRGEKSVTTDYKKYVGLENIMSQTGQYVQTGIEVDLTENLTFEVGDILFGKLRPYLRKYWRAEFSGTASSEFVIIKGSSLNLNFLFWAIQSDSFINDVDSSTYGSKMPRASWEYMKNIKLPFPESIEEQTQIADFLDKKVAQLDEVKSLLEEQIKTLEDYRRSLIYETVTKGLDKTVPLKDSGVDWIGQIPEGWEVKKHKYIMSKTKTLCSHYSGQKILSLTRQGIISRDIESGKGKMPASFDGYQFLTRGDLLLCLFDIDVTPRCVGVVESDGLTSPAYSRFKVSEDSSVYYYYYLFLSMDDDKVLLHLAKNLRNSLTEDDFGDIETIVPSYKEQVIIANYLNKKTLLIDKLIKLKKEQIENINKQRQALIYDYVTGKRRVRWSTKTTTIL